MTLVGALVGKFFFPLARGGLWGDDIGYGCFVLALNMSQPRMDVRSRRLRCLKPQFVWQLLVPQNVHHIFERRKARFNCLSSNLQRLCALCSRKVTGRVVSERACGLSTGVGIHGSSDQANIFVSHLLGSVRPPRQIAPNDVSTARISIALGPRSQGRPTHQRLRRSLMAAHRASNRLSNRTLGKNSCAPCYRYRQREQIRWPHQKSQQCQSRRMPRRRMGSLVRLWQARQSACDTTSFDWSVANISLRAPQKCALSVGSHGKSSSS